LTASDSQEPEGTTLNVYSYVVKKGKPVGPREVMRGTNLSSPSVAYWHLQKLKFRSTAEERSWRIHSQRENRHQRTHLDWTKSSAKTDVLLPIFSGHSSCRRCHHFGSILLQWRDSKSCSPLFNSN